MLQIQLWLDLEHRTPEHSCPFTDIYDQTGPESHT